MDVTSDNFIEQLVFFYVIRNYEMASIYKPHYFAQERLKKLFQVIQPYIVQYREEPSEQQTLNLLKHENLTTEMSADIIHSLWETRRCLTQYSEEWLKDTAKGYAEWNNFVTGLNNMHTYLISTQNEVTPENAHEYVQKVKARFSNDTNFNFGDGIGHDFFDPEEHKSSIVETRPTGYKFFDSCLHGGWAKKTFNVVMGPPKVGKSMWLCNLCANSVVSGDNCAYITLEMSVQLVNQRIGSNLLNIPMKDYEKAAAQQDVIIKNMQAFHNSSMLRKPGALIVEEFPTSSATVYDIEAFLLNAEKARSVEGAPFKFRNIFIDYVNIMADARHGNSAETYTKIKGICEDVRAMAQRNDWCVVSLTQTNRNGMGASDLDMTSVAESSGLVATVDSLFGIISTPMMKAEGIYYIKALALRNSPNMGDKKRYNFIGDYMRIREDESEDIIPDTIPLPSNLTAGANNGTNQFGFKRPNANQAQQQIQQPIQPQKIVEHVAPGDGLSLGVLENQINGFDLFI